MYPKDRLAGSHGPMLISLFDVCIPGDVCDLLPRGLSRCTLTHLPPRGVCVSLCVCVCVSVRAFPARVCVCVCVSVYVSVCLHAFPTRDSFTTLDGSP